MPALIVLLRGGAASRAAAASGYVLFVLAPMWWTPHPGDNAQYGFHGLTTLTANCFMLAGLAFLAAMGWYAWRPRRRPYGGIGEAPASDAAPSGRQPGPLRPLADPESPSLPAAADLKGPSRYDLSGWSPRRTLSIYRDRIVRDRRRADDGGNSLRALRGSQ